MSHVKVDLTPLRSYLQVVSDRGRRELLPALHHAQSLYGWLPETVQREISTALRVPLADIHGVIEFYTMFYNQPTAKQVVRVCEDPVCYLAGGEAVAHAIETQLGLHHGQTSPDGQITFEHVPCLGMCEHAPCALNGEKPAGTLTVSDVPNFLAGNYPEPTPRIYGEPLWMLHRANLPTFDPLHLESYRQHGGYADLLKALAMTPEELIAMMKRSGIVGRGGAMFPLGAKWEYTRNAHGTPSQKHVIANADESEPGTFKDHNLLEFDPFSLIEAMTIAGYAAGAENGWIFVRGEYPRSYARLKNAIEQARNAGTLGKNLFGKSGFHFDIELRLGAGAYICGEETALFEAIEGKRGFPRIKPPFPTTHGLFYQPTAINNVETFVAAMAVVRLGLEKWRTVGTEKSPGTKWFCVSGHVARPGVYELPFGLTIRQLIEQAGGIPSGKPLQAVLMGGAAGVFVGEEKLDTPLTYEDARAANIPLGSGVVMVFDETADLRQALYQLGRFFAHESCGKCFPCQLGTHRQAEILHRIANGQLHPTDRQTLLDIGFTMTESSLCGLGQTAASVVMSAIALRPELVS